MASPRFEPMTDVLLRGDDTDPGAGSSDARVDDAREAGNGWIADVSGSRPAITVFAATYFRYWRATVDGFPAPVEIANGNFCGVAVPPGRHRVALSYDERPFRAGALVELAAFAAIVILIPAIRWKRRRPAPEA